MVRGILSQIHSSRDPGVGDIFLKVVSCNPRERWPQWRISRLVKNSDGTAHAIMVALSDGMTTRRIALTALLRGDQWQMPPQHGDKR